MKRKLLSIAIIFGIFIAGYSAWSKYEVVSEVEPVAIDSNLEGIKTYLVQKTSELDRHLKRLQLYSDNYNSLCAQYEYDYKRLDSEDREKADKIIAGMKETYLLANTSYEVVEGIVAGVPVLSQYDIDLDAGTAASDGSGNIVSFDIPLSDGRVLVKPGNYFAITEALLWDNKWSSDNLKLPDAVCMQGIIKNFSKTTNSLYNGASSWTPNYKEAFTALVVMIPTMDEYFQSWKESRRISGENAESSQFIAVSRLSDAVDILSGLEKVYTHLKPVIAGTDPEEAEYIGDCLKNLKNYVSKIYDSENSNKKFSAEDSDLIGSEAQLRAMSIAGQVTQAAAKLSISLNA